MKARLGGWLRAPRKSGRAGHADSRLSVEPSTDVRHGEIHAEGRNLIGGLGKVSGTLHLGYASTIASGCHLVGGTIRIGRYCQFGPNVAVYALNHPFNHVSSYVNHRLFDGRLKAGQIAEPVSIGSDVWIGHGAIVLPGMTIGNSAVVGAGAVVTHDVPDFAIVAGNPARAIGIRFNEEIRGLLSALGWWSLPPGDLQAIEAIFHVDLEAEPARGAALLRQLLSEQRHPQALT